ncbi:hypothetical protein [Lysobacter sp. ESA13C]|uniref:hypothetical protein n=1 Tax=Lysobacter sp. ESA13C TaxID=2862676 RepID=UPI001CBBE38B|nr:hypothetical protein [Lysobacter sp. ESA13C]
MRDSSARSCVLTVAVAVAVAVAIAIAIAIAIAMKSLAQYRTRENTWRPGGRRTGRAPFFDKTGTSYRKIPAQAAYSHGSFVKESPFLWLPFFWASKRK